MKKAHPAKRRRASRALAQFSGWVTVLGPDRRDAVFSTDPDSGDQIRADRLPGEVIGHRKVTPIDTREPDPVDPRETTLRAFDRIKGRIRAAGVTLKRLPGVNSLNDLEGARSQLAQYVAAEGGPRRPRGKEIDQLDEVLLWLLPLPTKERKILSAYMLGLSLRRIGEEFGNLSKSQVNRRVDSAITDIVCRLAVPTLDVEKNFK